MRVENNCHSFFADTVDWWDIFLGDKAAGRYVHVAVQVRSGGVFNKTCIDQRLSSEGDLRQLHSFIRVQPGSFLCYFFLFFFRLHPLQLHRTTLLLLFCCYFLPNVCLFSSIFFRLLLLFLPTASA